jgi:hypothetical protein
MALDAVASGAARRVLERFVEASHA